jgi:hypothetical protein
LEFRSMTKIIVALLLLAMCAAPASAAPQSAMRLPHGPPDIPNIYICKVLPRYGGGACTTALYPRLGAACSCEGTKGPRAGVVTPR